MNSDYQVHHTSQTVGMKDPMTSKPFRALMLLRNQFSSSGRKFFHRILPFVEDGRDSQADGGSGAMVDLAAALLSVRGEASGVAIATDLLNLYRSADTVVRREFFQVLADRFDPAEQALVDGWERYRKEGVSALPALALAVEAPRQELFRRLNLAPGGTGALVRMRADLLAAIRDVPGLKRVDADLAHLLQSWFNRGFLSMRSIDWSSPASLLERLIQYEAVHDISSWAELRRRLDPEDRRCFAFFHPVMPEEPLIFVEVGLTEDIPSNIQDMLSENRDPIDLNKATTATFYSISNCQPGLRGISFGHFLIKQVAEDLRRELPNLKTFVTLSPIPGLTAWLRTLALDGDEQAMVDSLSSQVDLGMNDPAAARWFLEQKAVQYFTEARTPVGKPLDPVARFHLGNGARLERLNWRGDTSRKGLKQSGGLMVNYLYDLASIEENHEAFVERSEVIVGSPFRKLSNAKAGDSSARR